MKKLKKIMMSALAALCLTATTLGATSCGIYMRWGDDAYIHNGEKYVYVEGFGGNVEQKVTLGKGFNEIMVLIDVYTDVTDVDRNFIVMQESSKFPTHGLYIKESMVEEITDIKNHKFDEISFTTSREDTLGYNTYTYKIAEGFTFKEITSDLPTLKFNIPQDMMEISIACDFVEYPLTCGVRLYSNGKAVYVNLEKETEEYYEIMDDDFKACFLEIYQKKAGSDR